MSSNTNYTSANFSRKVKPKLNCMVFWRPICFCIIVKRQYLVIALQKTDFATAVRVVSRHVWLSTPKSVKLLIQEYLKLHGFANLDTVKAQLWDDFFKKLRFWFGPPRGVLFFNIMRSFSSISTGPILFWLSWKLLQYRSMSMSLTRKWRLKQMVCLWKTASSCAPKNWTSAECSLGWECIRAQTVPPRLEPQFSFPKQPRSCFRYHRFLGL